jgi:DNA-binding protein H-NS
MNAAAILSPFASTSSASEREKLRAQLTSQIAELNRQDEVERAALRAPIIDQMKALIAEHKISSTELFPTPDKAEARYRYYDEEETTQEKRNKTWNGRGTMPKALKGREDECLIPGQEHTKSIKKILEERALSKASARMPNLETSEVQAASDAAAPQPVDQNMLAVKAANQTSTPPANTETIHVGPESNTTEIHPASQETARPVASVETSSVALPT